MSVVPLRALAERWRNAKAAERANAQSYLIELCEALGVEKPRPAGTGYEFEYPIKVLNRDSSETSNFVDLYKEGCFVLEAKDADGGAAGVGVTARASDTLLRKAYGQARTYAAFVNGGVAPPYVLVLDVGRTLLVWDRWQGGFGGYQAARRIDLTALDQRPDDVALLRDVWTDPSRRDPRRHAQAVTREVAAKLAELAAALEARGFAQERVARFLMRVVFSCFAEDIGLLPKSAFRATVEEAGMNGSPADFAEALEGLWRTMDRGGMFGFTRLLRFNGHFFRDAEALPLARSDIALLLQAAQADWQDVEPTIFGTLLTRALDPEERHRLGAEYTPRDFIERLVRPTVEEPIRERWAAVQAGVLQLRQGGKPKDVALAAQRLREFHAWLRGLTFLDPACGSGNFLYVTMQVVKQVELEVLNEIAAVTGAEELRIEEVDPGQFFGLEKKAWAREIAELTLWIGYHQWWMRHHHVLPAEPVLRDTGTLERRDAVLAWDDERPAPERDRPDPTPRLRHQVTGEMVPDPDAWLRYVEHVGGRPAPWPRADFIVGNPPYLGKSRQKEAFGDGYVDALRAAYPQVPDGADYVMYWWHRAAEEVAAGRTIRAGLITTNSITQALNRPVVAAAAANGARVTWAIADHVWYDGSDGAEVRVAMTVIAHDPPDARLLEVAHTERVRGEVPVVRELRVKALNADLSAHADVPGAAAVPLRANAGVSALGFKPFGGGFVLEPDEAARLLAADPRHAEVIKPFRNGRDLLQRARGVSIIDFGLRSEEEARAYPVLYEIARARVKPERDASARAGRKTAWWRFGEPNPALRAMMHGLTRIIVTVETSKHHVFTFLPTGVAPEGGLVCIAVDDPFVLGVLGSAVHEAWALAAGGRMGVRDTPRYNKRVCFEPFPFPDPPPAERERVGALAMQIERHRAEALGRDDRLTLTAAYNLIARVRGGGELTAAERSLYLTGACGVLADLHRELDAAVAGAYGWSWPEPEALVIERLVALHDRRVEEERAGRVRWLRPEYHARRSPTDAAPPLDLGAAAAPGRVPIDDAPPTGAGTAAAFGGAPSVPGSAEPWPADMVGQITALQRLAAQGPVSVDEASKRFAGARRDIVARHLESLAVVGDLHVVGDGRYVAAATTY